MEPVIKLDAAGRCVAALILAVLTLACAGCVSMPPPPPGIAAPSPIFSPESFFGGQTEGVGTIAIMASGHHAVHVFGFGRMDADGTLVLSQLVNESGKPAKRRQWRIWELSPGRIAGTLSDAIGPIAGEMNGNMLHLRFRMAGGLTAEQLLYLQRDGRTVLNRMTVRKLCVVVAVLNETIRKVG